MNAHPAVTLSTAVLRDWAGARLAPYKRPVRIVFMDSLPAAANGKVLKHRLKSVTGS